MRLMGAIVALTALTSCASVQQETRIANQTGASSTVGIGDTVLRSEGRESMPNAFGGADIFGRTRPTGFSTVQYGGMQGNKVVLLRNNVATQSGATTMNSSGQVIGNGRSATYIPPAGSTETSVNQGAIPVLIDYRITPTVPMMGRVIVIESATPTSLTYRLE